MSAGLLRARTTEVGGRALVAVTPLVSRLRRATAPVTRLGWGVVAAAVVSWLVGRRFGWVELMFVAAAALLLLALCVVISLGRTRLSVALAVEPQRMVAGTPAAGEVSITNAARGILLPVAIEVPIGVGAARFTSPTLRRGASHEELFVVPTEHRGVIPIGPVTTVRGDPLGLIRREIEWTERVEVFVHPRTVPLEPLGSGLLRDLEGQTTNDISMSDLAFHALREYAPGDDRRYIHWRSSAKLIATANGHFLVRQFLDTRRSHITTVVDSEAASYLDPEDYEIAISAAASVAVRALRDEQEISVFAGEHAMPSGTDYRVLDTFSRADLVEINIVDLAARAARLAPDTSIALLITGSLVPFVALHRAALHFPQEVRTVVLRIDPAAPTAISTRSELTVLTLRDLAELGALLDGGLQ